jgi:hypothetical protein
MKKLLTALLVCTGSLALAQGSGQGAQQQQYPRQQQQQQQGQMGSKGLFNPQQAYEIQGTLAEPEGGELAIARSNLPRVDLDVRDETRFLLDGRQVEQEQLQPGMPVRARFQIDGDELVAVEIRATSQQGQQQQQQQPRQQQ